MFLIIAKFVNFANFTTFHLFFLKIMLNFKVYLKKKQIEFQNSYII